ncbi:MAG: YggT family protein [Dehalococcoidia bacterium]|nr:MAG: YggT family protein [Dehalococcoidia bacterium]
MSGVAILVYYIIQVITIAIFARVVLSWFMVNPTSGFIVSVYQVLFRLTEPILGPLRRIIPTIGMFDISPIVAIIALQVIGEVLVRALS